MNDNYKRKKDPIENRRLILESAVELANKFELSQISFDALAKSCGLSKGGIIHHFPTKESIFHTLFNESFDEYRKLVSQEMKSADLPNSSIALLRVNFRGRNDENYKKLMKVIFKCLVNNEQYCQQWNKWFEEDIMADLNAENETATLIGSLVAVGLWNMDALDLYKIEAIKMDKVLSTLTK